MASFTEKRLSLHKGLEYQQRRNEALESQIEQLQGLANIGTICYMIAHEINNLLTPLSSYATFALANPGDKGLAEKALEKVVRNCQRATEIMGSMLALANDQKQEKQNARLRSLVEEVFTCLCRDFSKDGIKVEISVPEDLKVFVVPVQIQQVLMNLILNARDTMLPRGGILIIKAEEETDTVQIEVSDTGKGIELADLKNIFESFFTTKTDNNRQFEDSGAGLGLAFCKRIIDSHKGYISVESEPDKGSTFKITLPKN